MASASPLLNRPLVTMEENWLKCSESGTGIAVCGIALKEDVSIDLIRKAAREVSKQNAILRAKVIDQKGKLAFQVSGSDAAPVEQKAWPLSNDGNSSVLLFPNDYEDKSLSLALHKIVEKELNILFSNDGVNVWEIHVYSDHSTKPQTIIILRMQNFALDRQSCAKAAEDLLTILNALVAGKPVPDCSSSQQNPGKDSLLPPLQDLIPKGKAQKGFLQKGISAIGFAWNSRNNSILPFQPNFTKDRAAGVPFQSHLLCQSLGKHGTTALFEACKKEGTSYSAALAAAFLKAAASIKELKDKKLDEFAFSSLVDCRRYLEPRLADTVLGAFICGIPNAEKVKESMSFWDLARDISTADENNLAKSKHFSEQPVFTMMLSQLLKRPTVTAGGSYRVDLFSIFQGGPMNAHWKNVEALEVVGTVGPVMSIHFIGSCFSVTEAMVDDGELSVSIIFATPVFSREQMETFFKGALEVLSASTQGY